MSSSNARMRGKIHRDEWGKIFDRHKKGETLAAIARSYRCTAPAIRYIVARATSADTQGAERRMPGNFIENGTGPVGSRGDEYSYRPQLPNPTGDDIWSRVNTDIASFLAAMDDLFVTDDDAAYETLLRATDRLLWASARTRLELEKVIAARKGISPRRRASA
jgi:hypothetical protein